MSDETLKELTSNLSDFVKTRQGSIASPLMGVIINASDDFKYCDVQFDEGTFTNIPAHGLPVIGDSAIVHFMNNEYTMPVADCARRLPLPNTVLSDYYSKDCFNCVDNGDFIENGTGFTGNYTIISDDSYTSEGNACFLDSNDNISFISDISKLTGTEFKFQMYYKGLGNIKIECFNNETNEVIQNLPSLMAYDYKVWNGNSRFTWTFNKETYPAINNSRVNSVRFNITNVTENDNTIPCGVTIDGLLIYNEDGNTNYYKSLKDVL